MKMRMLLPCLLALGGCASLGDGISRPKIPSADDVVEIRFVPPVDERATKERKPTDWPAAMTLTDAEAIREVVAWLKAVKWSDHASDTKVMGLPQPNALTLTMRDGAKVSFGVGDSHIIYGDGLWSADTERLKQILRVRAGAPEIK